MRRMTKRKHTPREVMDRTDKLLHVTPDEEEEEPSKKRGMPFMTMVSASYAPE